VCVRGGTASRRELPRSKAKPLQTLSGMSKTARDVTFAVVAIAAVVAASILGQVATFPNLVPWYASLHKPLFNPPNWIFAPVWTALYALMAFALWRILRLSSRTPGRIRAVVLFFVQLALNAAWSFLFFGAHSPVFGLIDIVPQLILILVTATLFARIDAVAGWCLVPLALWVAFAGALNYSIWSLNR
jgi:translocator protein